MARGPMGSLARLLEGGSVAGLTDGQLLDRFASRGGAGAEAAFEALVIRHGPMVARVCRQSLRDPHDVEDAFQATFLILVRRADSIGERDLLGPWLYGVAHRVARKARAVAGKRRGREGGQAGFDPPARLDPAVRVDVDLAPVLHEEVNRLPAKYRQPVILCHLQGLTHAEAAHELAWPVGTVSVRLARARKILADRLTRRGITTASVATVSATLTAEASAALVAPSWVHTVAIAALATATGLPLTTAVSVGALTLARRTSMTMFLSPWKWLAIPATAAALTTAAGVGMVGSSPGPVDNPQQPPTPVVAKAAPDHASLPTVGISDPPAVVDQIVDGVPTIEGEDLIIKGKADRLASVVESLRLSDPAATYQLRLSGGKIRFQPPTPPEANLAAEAKQVSHDAQTGLTVDLTGPVTQYAGDFVRYKVTVTNKGTLPLSKVDVDVALPARGSFYVRGDYSPGMIFKASDRWGLCPRVAQLEPGQSVENSFSCQLTIPRDNDPPHRFQAEAVSGATRVSTDLVTYVTEKPKPAETPARTRLEKPDATDKANISAVPIAEPQRPPVRLAPPPASQGGVPARSDVKPAAAATLDEIVEQWEQRGAGGKTLKVAFERIEKSAKWGDKVTRGVMLLKSPNRACLEFQRARIGLGGKPVKQLDGAGLPVIDEEREPDQRIVATGQEVVQYEWDEKRVSLYPIKSGSQSSPWSPEPVLLWLKVPFLFGLTAAEVRGRFDLQLIPTQDRHHVIALKPRDPLDQRWLRQAVIWLDRETLAPSRLTLMPTGGKDLQEFRFTSVERDVAISDAYFEPKTDIPGWKMSQPPPLPTPDQIGPFLIGTLRLWRFLGDGLAGRPPAP